MGKVNFQKRNEEEKIYQKLEEKSTFIEHFFKKRDFDTCDGIIVDFYTMLIQLRDTERKMMVLKKIDVDKDGHLEAEVKLGRESSRIKIKGKDIYCVYKGREKKIEEELAIEDLVFIKTNMINLMFAYMREKGAEGNFWANWEAQEKLTKRMEQKRIQEFLKAVDKITKKSYERIEKEENYFENSLRDKNLSGLKIEKGEDGKEYYMLKDTTGIYQNLPTLKNIKNMIKEPVIAKGDEYEECEYKADQERFAYMLEYVLVHIELNQLRNEGYEELGDEFTEENFKDDWYREEIAYVFSTKNIYEIVRELRKLNQKFKAEVLGMTVDELNEYENRKKEKKKRKEKL